MYFSLASISIGSHVSQAYEEPYQCPCPPISSPYTYLYAICDMRKLKFLQLRTDLCVSVYDMVGVTHRQKNPIEMISSVK